MTWHRLTVVQKLFAAFVITTITAVLFMAVFVAWNMRSGFSQYLLSVEIAQMEDLADALAEDYEADADAWAKYRDSPAAWHELARRSIQPLGRRPPPRGARDSSQPPPVRLRPPSRLPPPSDPMQLGQRLTLVDAQGARVAGAPLDAGSSVRQAIAVQDAGGAPETVGWLVLASPDGDFLSLDAAFLSDQFRALFVASVVAIVLAGLASIVLARQFTSPLKRLAEGTRQLASGDYGRKLENGRHDEFGELINHFNTLARSLETAKRNERQWLSDASHELQTPVAVIRAEIEAIQDGVHEPDTRSLGVLHDAVQRLSSLIADLNTLARTQEGKLAIAAEMNDLSAVTAAAVEGARLRLEAAGLAVETRMPEQVPMRFDPIRIRQLLDNLLENVLRYTDAPGKVAVELDDRGVGKIDRPGFRAEARGGGPRQAVRPVLSRRPVADPAARRCRPRPDHLPRHRRGAWRDDRGNGVAPGRTEDRR